MKFRRTFKKLIPLCNYLSTDPALWPSQKKTRDYWVLKQELPNQNIQNTDFKASKRISSDGTSRYCTLALFNMNLKNGENLNRDWLTYSPSTGKIYCFFCLLFGTSTSNPFKNGFCQWDHGHRALMSHQTDKDHLNSVRSWVGVTSKAGNIDSVLKSEFEKQQFYWREVLRKVVECLKFLCGKGLALRGDSENISDFENGNFLGPLHFLSKFDSFMAKHLEKRANRGIGHVSYISSTIYEEIVILMGKKVLQFIADEVKNSKYFAIVVDSSPDTAHCDQLAIILRYVTYEGMNTCGGDKGISSDCSEDDRFFTRERTLKLLELYKKYRKRLGSFEKKRNVNPTLLLSSSKSYQTDTLEASSVQISIPEESQSITSCSFEAPEPNTVQDSENRVKANTNNMPTAKIALKKKSQPVKSAYQKRNSILLELTNNVKSFYENKERRDAEKLELQRRKIANQEERTALAREYLELVKQSSTQCSNEDAEIWPPVD
ncbi:hypothetical protein NQ315_016273 [Exocentrus adspersus]|uniref:DUF4371 domain-containing protein n=1 Tax=Exocentrus adspersus TaxID=1586481 RepID=A0AAV8VD48_9CUCU|nr:hypothetical protein NQ315_016273 [Exocentrus adspersus]